MWAAHAGTALDRAAETAGSFARKAGTVARRAIRRLNGSRTGTIAVITGAVAGIVAILGLAAWRKRQSRRW
jgi:type IV secretory pathway VirB2 component (pilin)